jgi:hypothetical protein
MKKLLLLILIIALTGLIGKAQTETDTLTNEKIINLSKIGLQPSVIISKIQTSITFFKVSTNDLIDLSKNGVATDVITEMMKVVNNEHSTKEIQSNSKDPNSMHAPGIYIYYPEYLENPLTKLDAFVVNYRTSSGGYGGYGGSSTTANLAGKESKLPVNNSNPVFYFYFDNNTGNQADWYSSSSPNEFVLVKLIVKKNIRLFKVGGSSSAYGNSSSSNMIPEKVKIPFDYVKVKDGIYKITFKNPMLFGEYCFVFGQNTYKVFDFSIKTGKEK